MLSLACRSNKILPFIMSVVILYSFTCSVIAQDKLKEKSPDDYKLKLAFFSPPTDDKITIQNESITNLTPISKFLNKDSEQASLKLSPKENQNLLVSYIQSNVKLFKNPLESKFPSVNYSIKDDETQSLAYVAPTISPPTLDKAKWEATIRAKYKNGLIKTIAPGVKHIKIRKYTKSGLMLINVIEVNSSISRNISIQPVLAGTTLQNLRKVTSMVSQNKALAGVNASFFKSNGVPLGTLIMNEELITGPIFDRVTLGIGDGEYRMAKIQLDGKVITKDHEEIKIDNVNQPRMLATYTLIYTNRWGKIAPPSPQYGIQVAINNGKVVNVSKDRLEIPETGYVLVGPHKFLGKLKVNDPVKIVFTTNPDWAGIKHAVSGGPYLVKDGQIYVDAKEQKLTSITGRHPRTAVGYTRDNRLIILTVDGRQKGSIGATFYELARIMKEYGCYNAMNLDGGTSTQMVVNNSVVNYPLNKGGGYVSSGLIVKLVD